MPRARFRDARATARRPMRRNAKARTCSLRVCPAGRNACSKQPRHLANACRAREAVRAANAARLP
eukprot:14031165-Alexandrium_andersonii.AAC.1